MELMMHNSSVFVLFKFVGFYADFEQIYSHYTVIIFIFSLEKRKFYLFLGILDWIYRMELVLHN